MSVENSETWRAAIQAENGEDRSALVEAFVAGLGPADVPELLRLCARADRSVADLAVRALVATLRRHRAALPDTLRTRCVREMVKLVRREYPSAGIGTNAFETLRLLDREQLSRLVCDELDLMGMASQDPGTVTSGLRLLGTPRAVDRLKELSLLGGEIARRAEASLVVLGVVSTERVESVAAEWRRTRTVELLHRLHQMYTSRLQPGQAKAAEVKRLLGTPDDEDDSRIVYAPSSGNALTLEKDRRGRIVGIHYA